MASSTGSAGNSSLSFRLDSVRTRSTVNDYHDLRPRAPRSLPPWIDSYEATSLGAGADADDRLDLINAPPAAVPPTRNPVPSDPKRRVSKDGFEDWDQDSKLNSTKPTRKVQLPLFIAQRVPGHKGRKWDHLRTAEPVIVANFKPRVSKKTETWTDFVHSSEYGRGFSESEVVDFEVLNKLQPTFNNPIDAPASFSDHQLSKRKRTVAFNERLWHAILRHSLSPLLFRLTVIITSLLALGTSSRIYQLESRREVATAGRSQSILAVVVDVLAVPYVGYMLWDEYTGKPLGLRSAIQKTSLILMDLFFIIFKSASTSLAFESLVYREFDTSGMLGLSRALAAFMFLGLIAWTMTFMVNIFRTVERLGGGEDEERRM